MLRSRPDLRRPGTVLGVGVLLASLAAPALAQDAAGPLPATPAASSFSRLSTYPVFENLPAGVDPASETVAEISDVTEDGNTLVYTDATGQRIGFLWTSRTRRTRWATAASR